jgi:chromosome segregation ATPase
VIFWFSKLSFKWGQLVPLYVKAQLSLAHDNVRIKDAMLESQVELIASLKQEALRSREAQGGAVKAAAEAERAADARSRQLDDDLRACRRELAAQDAAVDRLEGALDDARGRKDAAEEAAEAARREVEELDQMLAYVSAEVESVKGMFAEREEALRRERDELAAAVADRDEVEAAARGEAERARGEAAAARAEVAEAVAAAGRREAAASAAEAAAAARVRRTEGEMRALLSEVAQQKKSSRERVQELGSILQSLYS